MSDKIRVLLVDDHFVMRTGLATSLNSAEDLAVVGEASDGYEAVAAFESLSPDVVVMDLRLPRLDGIEATRQICQKQPVARIIVLSSSEGDEDIHRSLAAGAMGYLSKRASRDELLCAIRAVIKGHRYVSPDIAQRLAEHYSRVPLSERELDVLQRIANGRSNREIATELSISEATVKFHVTGILAKLGVLDRTQAVTTAIRRGIVHLD
jgi:DNA-binding NarL/FixJ family response regulator